MPSVLVSTEIVIGTLLVVAVAVLATTFLRRRYIAKGLPLTLCGMRRTESDRWRLGLIRFGDNALEWYALGGVSVRPKRRWLRQRLLLEPLSRSTAATRSRSCPTPSRVPCSDGDSDFELALQGPGLHRAALVAGSRAPRLQRHVA